MDRFSEFEGRGELVERSTGLELSYLFWEAHTTDSPITPSASINGDVDATEIETVHPSRPILNSSNSILLPFDAFLLYLDTSLKSLTLHTATRNDFVTYWLPSFIRIHEKGQLISMRFVEEEAYEQAAVLEVEPKPGVVTRVFMLFKGVDATELGWEEARDRVATLDWRAAVGVKENAMDEGVFRVLEWGGIEVL